MVPTDAQILGLTELVGAGTVGEAVGGEADELLKSTEVGAADPEPRVDLMRVAPL